MLKMRRKRCKQWGCPNFHTNKNGYCDECNRKYRAKHPDRYNSDGSRKYEETRPSARQRGYNYKWEKFRSKYLAEHPLCAICGKKAQVVDHKTYTARQMMDAYGEFTYNEEDYQALCYSCNNRKGQTQDKDSDAEYFRMKEMLRSE